MGKRLTLSKETLRTLDDRELSLVVGGGGYDKGKDYGKDHGGYDKGKGKDHGGYDKGKSCHYSC